MFVRQHDKVNYSWFKTYVPTYLLWPNVWDPVTLESIQRIRFHWSTGCSSRTESRETSTCPRSRFLSAFHRLLHWKV